MKTITCPACGGKTKRNGKTSSGAQRWRCVSCGASTTRRYDKTAKLFELFLTWLLSKTRQSDMPGGARGFRRATGRFWSIWPIAPVCDEIHHFIHVDGIWLGRSAVILIACTEHHIVGWHLARSETSESWAALMLRIAPPDVVITDGGNGFEKARRVLWPHTRVQRCTFHAFEQVKRCTTTRPNLQAGVELYKIAKDLMHIKDLNAAAIWLAGFSNWCSRWDAFLKEKTVIDGKSQYKHERLRKARRGLEKLARNGTLFTYLDEGFVKGGLIPATNNRIEGGVNRQLRVVLQEHRGLSLTRRIKAVFWWCYMHTEHPLTATEILQEMATDDSIAELYRAASEKQEKDVAVEQWGTAVAWSELHTGEQFRIDWD